MKLVYENKLSCENDVKDFVLEGSAEIYFENGKMRMKNALSADLGQKSNFVYWCNEDFPSDVQIEWEFRPIEEPGLAILFFSAKGVNGEDLFDPSLQERDGQYNLYHSGDINAYHVSYFRRKWDEERGFHTCNLRKSKGFHLVVQGADPIPNCEDAFESYHIKLVKKDGKIDFIIDDLPVFSWQDDGKEYGPVLGGGKIGFHNLQRQLQPQNAGAEAEDIAVVVHHCHFCRIAVAADRSQNPAHFIGRNAHADSRAADQHAFFSRTGGNHFGNAESGIGIVAAAGGAVINNPVFNSHLIQLFGNGREPLGSCLITAQYYHLVLLFDVSTDIRVPPEKAGNKPVRAPPAEPVPETRPPAQRPSPGYAFFPPSGSARHLQDAPEETRRLPAIPADPGVSEGVPAHRQRNRHRAR